MTTRFVQGVSVPRSGHHLLVWLLAAYYGWPIDEAQHQKEGSQFTPYCEWYRRKGCCRMSPCTNPVVTFAKHHDHAKSPPLERVPGIPYLIQIREPVAAFASYFKLAMKCGEFRPEVWPLWRMHRTQDFIRFVERWIASPPPDSLIVHYNDLVADTVNTMSRVIRLFEPDGDVDVPRLVRAISTAKPRARSAFRVPTKVGNDDIKAVYETLLPTLVKHGLPMLPTERLKQSGVSC